MTQSLKLHLLNELANISGITFMTEEAVYEVNPEYKNLSIDELNQKIRSSWRSSREAGYFDVGLPRTCSAAQFKSEEWRHDPLAACTCAQRSKIFCNRSPEDMDMAGNDFNPAPIHEEIPFWSKCPCFGRGYFLLKFKWFAHSVRSPRPRVTLALLATLGFMKVSLGKRLGKHQNSH